MDFEKTNKILLEKSDDTVAFHKVLKEALGTKNIDILYYDKEKSIYFDTMNDISIQQKYLNDSSLLGTALLHQSAAFYDDFTVLSAYDIAIDNPFKIALYSQIIIPIFEDNESKGILRFSQLPKSFSQEDFTNLDMLLPAFHKIFSAKYAKANTVEKYSKIAMDTVLKNLEDALNTLSQNISNPEIEKLITTGHQNKDALKNYIHINYENKVKIQEKFKRLNRKKSEDIPEKEKIYANVLIADDVRINVKILNAMLSDSTIIDQIKYAYDGIETMDIIDKCKAADENIHILFLDHHMPGKTGLEIAQSLKKSVGDEGTIIIVSITNDPDVIASKGYLYDYHIPKPFNKESIQKVMEQIRLEHLS